MEEFHTISTALRDLLREADTRSFDLDQIKYRILLMSDEYMEKYEESLLKILVDEQKDPSHPRYDYGL